MLIINFRNYLKKAWKNYAGDGTKEQLLSTLGRGSLPGFFIE
jgi:hypothetical protein